MPISLRTHRCMPIVLSIEQKERYFEEHFPHRLILLRTFRLRGCHLPEAECPMDWHKNGDLIRCAKDSSIMAVRFWLEFFNKKGSCANSCKENCGCETFILKPAAPRSTDVRVDCFVPRPSEISPSAGDADKLGRVYVIGDKHVAHFTGQAADRGVLDNALVAKASEIIEHLIREHLYVPSGREMPIHPIVYG